MAKAKINGTMSNGRLRGRFMWLLSEMCRKCDLDVQVIDPALDYFENKAAIEREYRRRLFLKPDKRAPEEELKQIDREVKSYVAREMETERMFDECVEVINDAIKKSRRA